MKNKLPLSEEFIKALEWIKIPVSEDNVLYFFPESMTLIEHDEKFDRFLKDLKYIKNIRNTEKTLSHLYPDGYVQDNLYNLNILLEEGLLNPIPLPIVPKSLPFKRVVLANTLRCNMACTYCYNEFEFNCHPSEEKDMSKNTFKKLIKFLERNGKDIPLFELLFIGGEPLMKLDILEEAVKWREKLSKEGRDVLIIPTTNATLLTEEIIDFCIKYRIFIKVTLDGNKEEHDKHRVFSDGRGSYEIICKNLPLFFNKYDNPTKYVTTTIDTLKCDLEERVIRFSAMGFNLIELTELYFTDENFDFHEEELEEKYRKKYRKLFKFLNLRMKSRNYLHIIPIYDIIKKIHTKSGSFFPCRAGLDSISLSPDGTIYPCHHFYGDKRFAIGSVFDKKIPPEKLKPYKMRVEERTECSECWARFLCGGPCYHRSLAPTGNAFRCNPRECVRKKGLYKESLIFYINLKNEDPECIDWIIHMGENF